MNTATLSGCWGLKLGNEGPLGGAEGLRMASMEDARIIDLG